MIELTIPRRWVRVRSLYCFSITTAWANCAGVTSRLMTDSRELSYSRITARMSLGGSCSSTSISAASPSVSASSTKADSAPTMSPAAIRLWVLVMRARWFIFLILAVEALLDHPVGAGFFARTGVAFFFGVQRVHISLKVFIRVLLRLMDVGGRCGGLAVHVFQTGGDGQKPVAQGLFAYDLDQVLRPRRRMNRIGQAVPVGEILRRQGQQMFHHRRRFERKALMQDHRHHLGTELHHLQQEFQLLASLCQPLAHHVTAFGVRPQVFQLSLVGRAQVAEKGRNIHGLGVFMSWTLRSN